jgi:NAD(P)-dependent dehydrogenase (short-subunit alcohol dehydrogenase family)
MSSATEHSGRSAAVTGAGGGLGRDIALGLAAKGYVVFGTAVSPAEVQDLKKVSGGRVSLAVCDITKEQAVKAWAGDVSGALGNGGLDLLINNAGILTPGPLEVLPLDAIRHEFDVNVFGALSRSAKIFEKLAVGGFEFTIRHQDRNQAVYPVNC